MKVLWIEDHPRAQEMLMSAAVKAVRKRLQLDLVLAASLMEAERRIRFERFDLVVIDLRLPDSLDEGMTLTRVANMGQFRMAVVSGSENRDEVGSPLRPVAIVRRMPLPKRMFRLHASFSARRNFTNFSKA